MHKLQLIIAIYYLQIFGIDMNFKPTLGVPFEKKVG